MLRLGLLLMLALAVLACGDDDGIEADHAEPARPAAAATAVAPTPVTATPSPTSPPEPTPSPLPDPTDEHALGTSPDGRFRYLEETDAVSQDRLRYLYKGEVPVSATAIDDEPTEPTLVVAGHQRVQIIAGPDVEPVVTTPADSWGATAIVSALVEHDGEFIMVIGDADSSGNLLPPLLRWSRSQQQWMPIDATVTRTAAAPRGSLTSTPPSPPWGGASGITAMTKHDGMIWATGWATIESSASATVHTALWSSTNGVDWALELLPALGEGAEYGSGLSVNRLGVMVQIGNWTYGGAGILARRPGEQWMSVPLPDNPQATSFVRVIDSNSDGAWLFEQRHGQPDVIHRSIDFADWTQIELPDIEEREAAGYPAGGFWSLDPDHAAGPIAWYSTYDWSEDSLVSQAWQWLDDQQRFVTTTVPGHYVGRDKGYTITQDRDFFTVIGHQPATGP